MHPTSAQSPRRFLQDTLLAGLGAALTSGAPSTLFAWWTGADVLEATRAAGAMLIPADSTLPELIAAATVVHLSVSLFWAAVLTRLLPRKFTIAAAMLAAAGIAVLDLRVIGRFFPEVHALPFWPQFADHLAWGATVGAVLSWRFRREARPNPDRVHWKQ
jgi:hypothetical protein